MSTTRIPDATARYIADPELLTINSPSNEMFANLGPAAVALMCLPNEMKKLTAWLAGGSFEVTAGQPVRPSASWFTMSRRCPMVNMHVQMDF
jgi:hypothetical protein